MLACRQLDEQTRLSEAVQRHMQPKAGQASMHALLQPYVEAGIENLGLLLRQEHRPVSAGSTDSALFSSETYAELSCPVHCPGLNEFVKSVKWISPDLTDVKQLSVSACTWMVQKEESKPKHCSEV